MSDERLLTVKQVAELLSVRAETVRRWLKEGKVRGVMPGGTRSGYRIPHAELMRLVDVKLGPEQ
jgi:excisionase family DNA binding protein